MNELLIFLMTHRTLVTFNYEATRASPSPLPKGVQAANFLFQNSRDFFSTSKISLSLR